jgi:hypothetical protein
MGRTYKARKPENWTPFEKGQSARYRGLPVTSNPHRKSSLRAVWAEGWNVANDALGCGRRPPTCLKPNTSAALSHARYALAMQAHLEGPPIGLGDAYEITRRATQRIVAAYNWSVAIRKGLVLG